MERFRKAKPAIENVHREIWPGVPFTWMQSKKDQVKNAEQFTKQQTWFLEGTMSTSLFVAFIVFCLSGKFRDLGSRVHSGKALNALLLSLASALDGFSVEHVPIGSDSQMAIALEVDGSGRVPSSSFWDEAFFCESVQEIWKQDFKNKSKEWVSSKKGLGQNLSLADLICFCLDPKHEPTLRDKLFGPALDIMSSIARVLDESIGMLHKGAEDLSTLGSSINFKNQRCIASNVKQVWAQEVAEKLWSGTDSWFDFFRFVFFIMVLFSFWCVVVMFVDLLGWTGFVGWVDGLVRLGCCHGCLFYLDCYSFN